MTCSCGPPSRIELLDRRAYTWTSLDDGQSTTLVLVDDINLLPCSGSSLWLRVHAASIDHADGAYAELSLQGISRDPEAPDVIFDGGTLTRLMVRDQAAGSLLQCSLPGEVLATARLRLVLQQAATAGTNSLTLSAGLSCAGPFDMEAA